jgi:hypothetical protein
VDDHWMRFSRELKRSRAQPPLSPQQEAAGRRLYGQWLEAMLGGAATLLEVVERLTDQNASLVAEMSSGSAARFIQVCTDPSIVSAEARACLAVLIAEESPAEWARSYVLSQESRSNTQR